MDFRALACGEKEWRRKERFIALAMLSEGQSIGQTAMALQVSTKMIKRWLEIGMSYGMEAVLKKALRICDLTQEQINEITAWLATTQRTSEGPLKWSGDHARSAIASRFGLLITTHTAYKLLLDNQPRRGRAIPPPVRNDGTLTADVWSAPPVTLYPRALVKCHAWQNRTQRHAWDSHCG